MGFWVRSLNRIAGLTRRLEIHEDQFTDTFGDKNWMSRLHVRGLLFITNAMVVISLLMVSVSYDPKSSRNTQALCVTNLPGIVSGLCQNGVEDIQMTTTAVSGLGDGRNTVVTFAVWRKIRSDGIDGSIDLIDLIRNCQQMLWMYGYYGLSANPDLQEISKD